MLAEEDAVVDPEDDCARAKGRKQARSVREVSIMGVCAVYVEKEKEGRVGKSRVKERG